MAERKLKIFIVFLCLTISASLLSMEIKTVMSYDEIYSLQKDPARIWEAEAQFLNTLVNAPELLGGEEITEYLGRRIYMKKNIIENSSEEDELLELIIMEDTSKILDFLREKSTVIEGYEDKYGLMDFVIDDYRNSMVFYSLQKLKNYLNLIYMKNFRLFFTLDGKELDYLAENLIINFTNNRIDFNNSTIKKLALFGGEELLLRLGVKTTPLVMLLEESDYRKEYDLLSIMNDLYAAYSENSTDEKTMLPQLLEKYEKLRAYFSLKEKTEILNRRVLTIEKSSLDEMIPLVCEYIREYENIKLKKEILKTGLIDLTNNTVSRYSYEEGLKLSEDNLKLLGETSSSISDVEVTLRYFEKSQGDPKSRETNINDVGAAEITPEKDKKTLYDYIPLLAAVSGAVILMLILTVPRRNRAYLLKKIGSRKKALEIFQKLSFETPRDPDIHVAMAQLLEEMNREEEAISEYRMASRLVDLEDGKRDKK